MTPYNAAEERLTGKRSLHLLLGALAVTLGVAFFGELAIMFVLPHLLPADASELTRTLLDASLLALLLAIVILPLLLHLRRRNLRVLRRALRLQYTLDQHAIVSITDVTGRITFANDRFCQISGYAREDLLGQNHRILKSGAHPPEVYEDMWRTIANGGTWNGEVCNRNKAGGFYWVHATITPFMNERGKPEEYIAIRTEITVQKELEKASNRQEAWLRTILDNLGEGVYTLDARGKLAYLNAEAERLIGWRTEELVGKGLHDVIHHHRPDGRVLPAAECPIHLAMRDRRVYRSSEEVFFHKDGSSLPVKITGAPLALDGEWQGSVAVFSDMREERLLQQHLLDAKNAAEDAARLKGDFLSTMSHEIRTPLNGVVGMTDLLLDTPLDGEQTEFARTIKTSADALMAIINDILDFSKIEAGRLVLEHTDFSLRQTLESSLDVLATRAQEKDLTLASFVAPELPDHLIGDPTRIRQILLNFLSNAIKFTERGEVVASATLEGEPGEPGTDHGFPRTTVKLAVRDRGIGLTATAIAGLFQPFSQADSSTTRKYGGTGLGLSICKRLVEAMGGEIGVDSVPGEGSSFWVKVPLEVAPEKREHLASDAVLHGRRVLVAGRGIGGDSIFRAYFEAWRMDFEAVTSLAELRGRLTEREARGLTTDALLLAHPLTDATVADAVAALRAQGTWPMVCCMARPDRETKSALVALDVGLVVQPLKQSTLGGALATALGAVQTTPARRLTDQRDPDEADRQVAAKHRLLLAEDNPVNQRVAVHMLGKLGYAVDVVDNGALAVAAVAGGNYALVLMDCQMPEMDGFAATAAIRRAEARSRHLPIVAMTANAMQGDREQCLAAGMDDYLAKPIDATRLAALLAEWLPTDAASDAAGCALAVPDSVCRGFRFAGRQAPTLDTNPAAIDMRRLTDLFGDDEGVIDELLAVFQQSLRPLRERLKREVREHGDELKPITHELRGAAANVGALPLAELAGRLENLAPGRNRSEIEPLAARVDEEFDRIDDFIAGYAKRPKT
ncbi:MAG: PAS domain S-box protein [Rhodocyclales bacterium]|nr:PAS domain S-box protein [Rhodocyclales bacterium]